MRNRNRPHFKWTPGGPLPENLSRLAEQVADLVLRIPAGRWGDLGDALGTTGKAVADAGLTLSPTPGETLMPPQWRVPWHRVRMADGSHRAPGFVTPEQDWEILRIASEWWEAEGGKWVGVRGGRYEPAAVPSALIDVAIRAIGSAIGDQATGVGRRSTVAAHGR